MASGQNDGLLQGHTQGAPVEKQGQVRTSPVTVNAPGQMGLPVKGEQYVSWEKYSFFWASVSHVLMMYAC